MIHGHVLIKGIIGDFVDCGPCFRRPHSIFGRVRNVEVKPLTLNGTPALPGAQGRHRSRVGSFPEARPVLGEVTETLCAAGTEDFEQTGCGCFPRARHTPGESAFWRKWVLSPGETYPGRECLLG